ncbi:hypothetical protein H5410_037180 [Solanum commersonii]|uniref:Uncharacterized protein n=1 Tax=Solanum commersonii TaxID=4109 RepID=A0A9J5Y9H5_SOLCO|nr:hypothetical protein H5410_037180 [Solanum commersonii]
MVITFRNIEPTTMKIKILQLPPPTVQSISPNPHIECSDHNKAIESDDDFQHPPFITTIKGKEKVIERSSPINNKKKYVPVSPKKSSPKAIKLPPRRPMSCQVT